MSEEREQRNQVFAAQQAAHAAQQAAQASNPGFQAVAAAEKVKAEFGLDIPVDLVPLPSKGKVYAEGSSLHGKDRVELRAMTAREEDILTSKALLKKGTVITELIKSCLADKSVNPSDLLTGDRNALMVAIRATGYGAAYDAAVECGECGHSANQTFNLGALPILPLELEPRAPGENAFEFLLPKCKKRVIFKFMSGRDEEEIMAIQERQKKMNLPSDNIVTTNLLFSIISIDGITDRAKISAFVKTMPALDSLTLREYIKKHEPGISMKQEVVCPACGSSSEVSMPIGVTFLWPGAR